MQKLEAACAALLAALVAYKLMLLLPGIGESTAAVVGATAAVAGWNTVMYHGKAQLAQA